MVSLRPRIGLESVLANRMPQYRRYRGSEAQYLVGECVGCLKCLIDLDLSHDRPVQSLYRYWGIGG